MGITRNLLREQCHKARAASFLCPDSLRVNLQTSLPPETTSSGEHALTISQQSMLLSQASANSSLVQKTPTAAHRPGWRATAHIDCDHRLRGAREIHCPAKAVVTIPSSRTEKSTAVDADSTSEIRSPVASLQNRNACAHHGAPVILLCTAFPPDFQRHIAE